MANYYFFFANLISGVIHYLFQVYAGRTLDLVAYGAFNSWFALISVLTVASLFIQYLPNLIHIPKSTFRISILFLIVINFVFLWRIFLYKHISIFEISIWYLVVSVGYGFIFGIAQSHLFFILIATATLLQSLIKFLFGFFWTDKVLGFYLAPAVSYVPALLPLLLLYFKPLHEIKRLHNIKSAAFGTFILSFITVFIPQMDILIVKFTQNELIIGEFARVSLFYKGVFFFFLIIAQMLLPKQTQAQSFIKNLHITLKDCFLILLIGLLTGGISTLLFKPITNLVFNTNVETPHSWVFLSLLHISLLTFIFFKIQAYVAKKELRLAFVLCSVLIVESIILILFKLSVPSILTISCSIEFIGLLLLTFYIKHLRKI